MIHIATAHHHSTDWLEVQRAYLDRTMSEPFLLYGSLQGLPSEYERFVDVVVESMGNHAGKLNLMGRVILDRADPEDLIIFLDGDAFPVADPVGPVRAGLATTSLVAVQRLENYGDCQPHPSFCAVPAQVWADLPGDWSSGHCYREGRTDVGGNLLWSLERAGLPWTPVLRSHALREHSLLFGVYGGFVYHHGAGFRGLKPPGKGRETFEPKLPATAADQHRMEGMQARNPERFDRFLAAAMETAVVSEQVYDEIIADPDYFDQVLQVA